MRPEVDCCEIEYSPYPSGWRWTHSRDCEVAPNQKVASDGELLARSLHPAGKDLGTGSTIGGPTPVPGASR